MASRAQAAELIKTVKKTLEQVKRQEHVVGKTADLAPDDGRLTAAELDSRTIWDMLIEAADVQTHGNFELEVLRAEAMHQLGGYKHLEGLDEEAAAHFAKAEQAFKGLIDSAIDNDEVSAAAKKYAGRLQANWAFMLDHKDNGDDQETLRRFKEAVAMGLQGKDLKKVMACIQKLEQRCASTPDTDVSFVGEKSWQEKENEKRKRNEINLEESEEQSKRSRQELKFRVAVQRSIFDEDIRAKTDARREELLKPAVEQWMSSAIDVNELERRKVQAETEAAAAAAAENGDLAELEAKFAAHNHAVEAQAAAEKAAQIAEVELQSVLRRLEERQTGGPSSAASAQAGPSGS